jgi:GNAT superfamily N-acetyltransferase
MSSDDRLTVDDGDPELAERLDAELSAYNLATSGVHERSQFSVRIDDDDGALVGGLSGWVWGTCAGISLVWVREDRRAHGAGSRLVAAAERVARERGCHRIVVSSFTFQAPGFYERHGFVETGRVEGLPVEGSADVHLNKRLRRALRPRSAWAARRRGGAARARSR